MSESLGGPEPLRNNLRLIRLTEDELFIQLQQAAEDVERTLRDANLSLVRRAQYTVAMQQIRESMRDLFRGPIADTVEIGKRRAADAAADTAYEILVKYATIDGEEIISRESFRATAREGINSLVSRSSNNVTLAERVYRNGVAAGSAIDRVVNSGLASGQSAREIAKAAAGLIKPDVQGGVSYAARRLGRTEINNAFHTSTAKVMAANPFVESLKWNLSKSHPTPDECDSLAAGGPYPPTSLPARPHPQCFCYMTAEVLDEADFIRNFKSGQYDDFLDAKLRGEDTYGSQERAREAALNQRRVVTADGKQRSLGEMTPQARARYLTAEERRLLAKPSAVGYDPRMGPSNEQKIRNAEVMYGTNSPQHKAAIKRFGPKK